MACGTCHDATGNAAPAPIGPARVFPKRFRCRISAIDLRATAVTALAMIAVILVGFVVSIARGGSGWPYDMIGFVGGLAYVAAVVFFRARG